MRGVAAVVLTLTLGAAGAAAAQREPSTPTRGATTGAPRQVDWAATGASPAGDWRTLEVPGYRLHFPAPAEPWARHVAARLPAVRNQVAATVGWDADEVVDVVLADPIAQPYGVAWALLGRPRLVLLLTPPGASSQLGTFVDWPALLVTHEQAHLSHLLRPSRQPLFRLARLPMGPISLRAPRWAIEGYATLLEGRLTGSGRPASAYRAAVLRRWAQRGKLPSYPALANDSRRYLGGSLAYLGGSAFLEWLEQRGGDGSLDRLWRRLTARQARGFDEAFRGVFGDSPESLWGRFSAELTWQAIEVERRVERADGGVRDGEPWLRRGWGTGRPALSRDGARLVVALAERDQPTRLAVYATAPDEEAARRREEAKRRALERDPEDAPAVESGAPPREAIATLPLPETTVDPTPRFLADGTVLFARSAPDREGSFRSDLYRWSPERGSVDRLTRGADLRAADPAPDGTWAVAVESHWGQTRLVRVELGTGEVTELTPRGVEVVVDAPRLAPGGARIAYLRHRGEGWELVLRDVAGGGEAVVPTPAGAAVQDPAWSPAGDALLAVVSEGGVPDVRRLALPDSPEQGAATVALTRSLGAAFAPEPVPDGTAMFFLALEPEGLQVRRIELTTKLAAATSTTQRPATVSPQTELDRAELYPALPPPPAAPPAPLALAEVPASRHYGVGKPRWSQLSAGSAGPGAASAETGVRGGDVVGRWDLLALGAVADGAGAKGFAAAGAWRGWPVTLSAHAYHARERPSAQRDAAAEAGRSFDLTTSGLELAAAWQRWFVGGHVETRFALGEEALDPGEGAELRRRGALLDAVAAKELRRGRWRLGGELGLGGQAGTTAGDSWNRHGGKLTLELGRGRGGLAVTAGRVELGGHPTTVDQLRVGGLPSTLLPPFATGNRIEVPALPAAALVGSAYEGQRVALTLPRGPLRTFWERHRVEHTEGWSDWLALAGAELELRLPPLPVVDLPAARLHVGAAYGLDEPYEDDLLGWAVLAWRP